MKSRVLPFIGGLITGFAFGLIVPAGFMANVLLGYPVFFTIVASVVTFIGGVLAGARVSPKTQPVRMTGRVFEFPQGPIMVEVALRRAKSIIPGRR